jgi:hypothetical protein
MRNNNNNNRKNGGNGRNNKDRVISNNTQFTLTNDRKWLSLNEQQFRSKVYNYSQATTVAIGGNSYDLTGGIVQGNTVYQRVGDLVYLKRISFRSNFYQSDVVNLMRMILIYSPGIPSGTSLATYLMPGVSGNPDITSFTVPYTRGIGFKILFDQTWAMSQNSSVSMIATEFSVPINLKTAYVQSSATVASGSLYMFWLSDSSVIPHPALNLNLRLEFMDL